MDKLEKLEELVRAAKEDGTKFYTNGNKAAGTRLRKHMQELKNVAQEIRTEVTDKKNQE